MRKFVMAALALCLSVGLTVAAEVIFVKYDDAKKELTVKEGDKEATYKITDSTKVFYGDKEAKVENFTKALLKAKEGKSKYNITTDKDTITEVKLKGKK